MATRTVDVRIETSYILDSERAESYGVDPNAPDWAEQMLAIDQRAWSEGVMQEEDILALADDRRLDVDVEFKLRGE